MGLLSFKLLMSDLGEVSRSDGGGSARGGSESRPREGLGLYRLIVLLFESQIVGRFPALSVTARSEATAQRAFGKQSPRRLRRVADRTQKTELQKTKHYLGNPLRGRYASLRRATIRKPMPPYQLPGGE